MEQDETKGSLPLVAQDISFLPSTIQTSDSLKATEIVGYLTFLEERLMEHAPLPRVLANLISQYVPISFRFDSAYNNNSTKPELIFEQEDTLAIKLESRPDVSFAFGNLPMQRGIFRWNIKVLSKGDEMWMGITDDREKAKESLFSNAESDDAWLYYDGIRSYRPVFPCRTDKKYECKPIEGIIRIGSYGVGDVVGFCLDVDRGWMWIYLNGIVQSCCSLPLKRTWYPIAVLDSKQDSIQFVYDFVQHAIPPLAVTPFTTS